MKTKYNLISLFSGAGGMDLGFKQAGFNILYANDFNADAVETYKKNISNNIILGDITKISSDELPDNSDVVIGGFPCFIGNTLIQTSRGIFPIADIANGDKVLTHNNRYMPVLSKMIKYYNDVGYKIHFPFIGKDNIIECTKDHPFYVYNDGNPVWKEAEDLSKNDYCLLPINNELYDNISFSYTKHKNQFSSETFNIVLDDEDWWWCVGYYIGDGWYQKRRKKNGKWVKSTRITLATNPLECDYVVERFSKFFNCNIQEDKRKIVFSNSCFYNFVKELGDNASKKHLPNDFDKYPINILKSLIKGYNYADGHVRNDGIICFTTISKKLAFQVFLALIKIFNTMPVFSFTKRPNKTIIEGRVVNQRDTYEVRVKPDKEKEPMIIKDNGFWVKIKNIAKFELNDFVYNLEVEKDNSYTANGIAVHNCQGFSVANTKRSMEDKRNFLYLELLRVIKDKQPKIFVAENVKGLLSMGGGKVIEMIINDFEELGYDVDFKLLNTADYGVPQYRERIIIIGNRCGVKNIFPESTYTKKSYITTEEAIGYLSDVKLSYNPIKLNGKAIYNHMASTNVSDKFWTRKHDVDQVEICDYLKSWKNQTDLTIKDIDNHFGYKHTAGHWFRKDNSGSIPSPDDWWELKKILNFDDKFDEAVTELEEKKIVFEQSLRLTNWDRPSATITATSPAIHVNKKRRLSARECAILQTFPDDFVFVGSLSSMYRQIGNAVPVLLAKEIGVCIIKMLDLCV